MNAVHEATDEMEAQTASFKIFDVGGCVGVVKFRWGGDFIGVKGTAVVVNGYHKCIGHDFPRDSNSPFAFALVAMFNDVGAGFIASQLYME